MTTNNTYGIIIQVRNDSNRLTAKMTKPFYKGETILELILTRLIGDLVQVPVIVATTTKRTDDPIVHAIKKFPIRVFRGDEQNVLDRIFEAASLFGIDNIIRVCADNPFLNTTSISELITCHKKVSSDYISYLVGNERPAILSHFGFYAELVTRSALKKVLSKTKDPLYLEHVTNYIYTNPSEFNLHFLNAPAYLYNRQDIRLTVDTIQDFRLAQSLYAFMIENNWDQRELVNFIDSNKELKDSMIKMIEQNKK